MKKRYYKDDIYIENTEKEVKVYDGDGELIDTLNKSWSEEKIMYMIEFANKAFSLGVEIGEATKERQIAGALGMITKESHYNELRGIEKRLDVLEQRK